jgi:hypothetical protein
VGSPDDNRGRHCWPAVAAAAAQRHGVLSLAELADAGLGPRGAQHRADAGHLHRLFPGVYAVGHPGVSVDGWRRAATVACGADALLSHRSAAAAWGLCDDDPVRWHVTVPRRGLTAPRDVHLHFTRRLDRADLATLRAVPTTAVPRTLVDLAAVLEPEALERAVHQAAVLRLLDRRAMAGALERACGRRGVGRLRALVGETASGPIRSELERRFLTLCRRAAVPRPEVNARVRARGARFEVDALWRDARVGVELDGAAFHLTRRAFEVDRRRDAVLAAAGYVVLRYTWRRISEEPEKVVGELRAVLAARGGQE